MRTRSPLVHCFCLLLCLAASSVFAKNYTLAELLAGISAHETRIQSAEFDLTREYLPSQQHPQVPAGVKLCQAHYYWESDFDLFIKGNNRDCLKFEADKAGKFKLSPQSHDELAWDHKQLVWYSACQTSKMARISAGTQSHLDYSIYMLYRTPLQALGYGVVDAVDPELSLGRMLAKYGAKLASPQPRTIASKQVYVIETGFGDSAKPLKGERVFKLRLFICPELDFAPLGIEFYRTGVLYRRMMTKYNRVEEIVFPVSCTDYAWFPVGDKKGQEVHAPVKYSYATIKLNQAPAAGMKTIKIPDGTIVYDYLARKVYEKGSGRLLPKAPGM